MSLTKQLENPYAQAGHLLSCITRLQLAVPSLPMEPSPYLLASGILALRGLGKEIWAEQDAQEYVRHLREEWDD